MAALAYRPALVLFFLDGLNDPATAYEALVLEEGKVLKRVEVSVQNQDDLLHGFYTFLTKIGSVGKDRSLSPTFFFRLLARLAR